MQSALLVLNAGSSSLKFAVYWVEATETPPTPIAAYHGVIEEIGRHGRFHIVRHDTISVLDQAVNTANHVQALRQILNWLENSHPGLILRAAGHRVVHGGDTFSQPVRVDALVLAALEKLIPLSPLHQPHNLGAIHALAELRPDLAQVACFDTAFHHTLPGVARHFALPRDLAARGIRRYGFHGLSYEYIASVLPNYLGATAEGRVVVAHLGNGASVCALKQRQSLETSMSFTPLDGLPMGTRCGAIDPGVLLYLLREEGMPLKQLEEMLNQRSGLLGYSGISSDVRALLASDHPHASEALELFSYRISQTIAAHAVALGGLDALVFTAGIGEHATPVRTAICDRLRWLGITLDETANLRHGPRISDVASPISTWVIPTNEEWIIARHTWAQVIAQTEPDNLAVDGR